MVHVCGPGRAHQAHELDSNLRMMDSSRVNPHVAEHVDSAQHAMQDRIDDLKQQIRQSDDPAEKLALENEIMKLEEAFDKFKSKVMSLSANMPFGLMGFVGGKILDHVNAPALREAVADFRNLIADSYQQFGTAEMPAKSFCGTMAIHQPATCGSRFLHLNCQMSKIRDSIERMMDRAVSRAEDLRADNLAGSDKASATDGTSKAGGNEKTDGASKSESSSKSEGTAQSEGAESTEGSGEAKESDFDASEMLELFNDDPMAFYDKLGSMSSEDRNTAMMMVQNEMQQINQMFSMISNLAKSMHDTSKAMINNMRV